MPLKKEKRTTKKELFNELYTESLKLKKKDRRKKADTNNPSAAK